MDLAFFIECSCPPERRGATVAGGDFTSLDDFLASQQLTHIECQACGSFYQLVRYIDAGGVEHPVTADPDRRRGLAGRMRWRLAGSRRGEG